MASHKRLLYWDRAPGKKMAPRQMLTSLRKNSTLLWFCLHPTI